MIARFNSQFEPLYVLLREVERIRLAPEILEPEPVDISSILGYTFSMLLSIEFFLWKYTCFHSKYSKDNKMNPNRSGEVWSGEATRHKSTEETQVAVTIGDESASAEGKEAPKERPVWLLESTVIDAETSQVSEFVIKLNYYLPYLMIFLKIIFQAGILLDDNSSSAPTTTTSNTAANAKNTEDIMSVLLQHEKRGGTQNQTNLATASIKNNEESSDSSGEEPDQMGVPDFYNPYPGTTRTMNYQNCILFLN